MAPQRKSESVLYTNELSTVIIKSEPSQSQNPQQSNVIMAETNACEEIQDLVKVEDLDSLLDNEGMDKLSKEIKLPQVLSLFLHMQTTL